MDRLFYIFRHGETDWNKERRCQGHTNVCLNDRGREQAFDLAQKLFNFPIEVIVSSDLDRALSTGTVVATKKGIPLLVDARLREMNYGQAEGLLYDEAIALFGSELWQDFQSFEKKNDHIGFPGGEVRKMARERFHAVLLDLVQNTTYQVIGISTHGGALRNILHGFLPENHSLLSIPNCVVYKCEYIASSKTFVVDPQAI